MLYGIIENNSSIDFKLIFTKYRDMINAQDIKNFIKEIEDKIEDCIMHLDGYAYLEIIRKFLVSI